MTRIGVLLSAVLAAAALAVPAAGTSQASWRTYKVPRAKVALDLPSSWLNVSNRTPELKLELRKFAHDNPELAPYLDGLRPRGAIAFIAVDRNSTTFLTNATVIRSPSPGLSLSDLRRALVSELKSTGNVRGKVATRIVATRAGRALEARYTFRSMYAKRTLVGATTQYLYVRKGTLYVLTFSAAKRQQARYRPVFERSGRSFRYT
jgi:hypothetical protein